MSTLDLAGLLCPHVVLRLADHLRTLPPGARLAVISTDPLSAIDVPFYLEKVGHRLISRSRSDGRITFVVERGLDKEASTSTSAETPAR